MRTFATTDPLAVAVDAVGRLADTGTLASDDAAVLVIFEPGSRMVQVLDPDEHRV